MTSEGCNCLVVHRQMEARTSLVVTCLKGQEFTEEGQCARVTSANCQDGHFQKGAYCSGSWCHFHKRLSSSKILFQSRNYGIGINRYYKIWSIKYFNSDKVWLTWRKNRVCEIWCHLEVKITLITRYFTSTTPILNIFGESRMTAREQNSFSHVVSIWGYCSVITVTKYYSLILPCLLHAIWP